MMIFTQR